MCLLLSLRLYSISSLFCFFFFFQAEDGIRDVAVTGVQTCALPISSPSRGVLREPFDPVALAQSLEATGAVALSVLTEPEFFRGSLKNLRDARQRDRKSTRLNSSHGYISYAVFCLKKKTQDT